ncbi:hypothetical protein LEP3755_32980 [Leptolyngbya sp. NIES-3755]|nr:hypothetical protein LEP3755_32980 [Leptolyngbya sp. NIES-3755]
MLSSILTAYLFGAFLISLIIFIHWCFDRIYVTLYFHHIDYLKCISDFIREDLFSLDFFQRFFLLCFIALPLILETGISLFFIVLVDTYLRKLSIIDIFAIVSIPSLMLLLSRLPAMSEKMFYLQGAIVVDEDIEVTPIFTCFLAIGLIAGFLTAKYF